MMAKFKQKKQKLGAGDKTELKTNAPSNKSVKKKTFGKQKAKHHLKKMKSKAKMKKKVEPAKNIMVLPPKNPQEFSANWKTLLKVLDLNPTAKKAEGNTQEKKDVNVQGKQPQKTQSFHKNSDKPDKHSNKPTRCVEPEKHTDQQNGKDPTEHKQYKSEKRKRNEETAEKTNSWSKKKKVEEVEKKTADPDIWFDDVDPDDIESALGTEVADIVRKRNGIQKCETEEVLVKERGFEGVTPIVALDCEMVGVGPDGEESMLARVSIVNKFGKCIYDKYVKPTEKVTDYRTDVSGIRPADIANGEDISTVRKEVAEILKGRILVGHAIHNDLKILLLDHPKKMIRDTQKYKPFKKRVKSGRPALRVLCREILNVKVQQGEHSSVQDAQATMRLYTLVRKQWEAELKGKRSLGKEPKTPRKPKAPKTKSS